MRRIKEAIVVEGKYDVIRLKSAVDAVIIPTDGFGVFRSEEKREWLRRMAAEQGVILLTDSDSAGMVIRNYLLSFLPPEQVKIAYVPPQKGKEKRKTAPSKEGLLGVEGTDNALILAALERAGATFTDGDAPTPGRMSLTRADLYERGLIGQDGSAARRQRMLQILHLPENLSVNRLTEVLNATVTPEEFEKLCHETEEISMNNSKNRILCVGSVNMDLVIALEDHAPAAGETVFGTDYRYVPGGKGANQAVAAARMGGKVTFLGRIGHDDNGRTMKANFEAEGMDTRFLEECDRPTGLAPIQVEPSGQNRIIVISGANMTLTAADVEAAFAGGEYDCVLVGLEVPLPAVHAACREGVARGIPVILDAGPAMKLDLAPLQGLTVLSPNETEAEAITGIAVVDEASAIAAAKWMDERCHPTYVVIKMGAKGSFVYGQGIAEMVPSFPCKAVDSTAAGDCYTAVLALEYVASGDMLAAARYASAAAGISVTRPGAQPSLPRREEVDAFLAERG